MQRPRATPGGRAALYRKSARRRGSKPGPCRAIGRRRFPPPLWGRMKEGGRTGPRKLCFDPSSETAARPPPRSLPHKATIFSHISNRCADPLPSLLGKVARSAEWGMGRGFGPSDPRPSPQTCIDDSCSPHPIRRYAAPSPLRGEGGMRRAPAGSMTCVNPSRPTRGEEIAFTPIALRCPWERSARPILSGVETRFRSIAIGALEARKRGRECRGPARPDALCGQKIYGPSPERNVANGRRAGLQSSPMERPQSS